MKISLFVIIIFFTASEAFCGVKKKEPNLFIFSIGINDYKYPFVRLENCISDTERITQKLIEDFRSHWAKEPVSPPKITTFTLTGQEATYSSIKSVFDSISEISGPNDYFVFFFAGFTVEDRLTLETVMIPYTKQYTDSFPYTPDAISLNMLSKWMEPVQCQRQLIISEAGYGKTFGMNLIRYMFEADPILASDNSRERIIITTNGIGLDVHNCTSRVLEPGGPLVYFLLQIDDIFRIFHQHSKFEYDLMRIELECNMEYQEIYSKIFYEKEAVVYYCDDISSL
ncbi:MAG: hypothetical protein ISS19_18360 [Bacteroidales bacterium]|nr:hypothetical protein [Bacteroidales bacterium]